MAALHGPIAVSSNLQVRLPAKVARQLHISAGDEFFVRVSDDDPSVILLLPVEVVERRYSAGELLERSGRSGDGSGHEGSIDRRVDR
ncbi:AbrB/MazE/SpoVT family DNA-binding domain-containing protein [Aeromicrobium erythreum]|uniref:AbrB/MazE/SpoVT family DNA-binding domain-containing protein n=1 Tax=Aeromicrobium erythreum TaxID=2041 RepID=UPI0009F8E9D1